MGTITGVDLFGFTVRNKEKTVAFYRDVLGLDVTGEDERGAEFTFSDGTTFGIWQPDSGEFPLGGGIMFAVPDAKAAVTELRRRGAELTDVMESPVCHMSIGSDPEGNRYISSISAR